MNKSIEFWNTFSGKYDTKVNQVYAKAYQDTIIHAKKHLKQTDIALDFACGTGITTTALAASVKHIDAIDTAEKMIALAQQKCREQAIGNVRFMTATLYDKHLQTGAYDVVFAFNVLCYMKDYARAIRRIHTLLKPGGLFISATDCEPRQPGCKALWQRTMGWLGRRVFLRHFSTQQLRSAIEGRGFCVMETQTLHPDPPNYFVAAKKQRPAKR